MICIEKLRISQIIQAGGLNIKLYYKNFEAEDKNYHTKVVGNQIAH